MPLHQSNKHNRQEETSDDDAPPTKRQRIVRLLDWRLEPSKSFSDWRILITDEDDEDAAPLGEYNVHRNILAFGDHASDYFAKMFETDMVEHHEQCSKISLSKAGAKAFPYLLDFIYQKEIKIEAPELFIYLYSLKDYFQVEGMDGIIAQGVLDACKDYDTLIRLYKTARELDIDTANGIIFTPMKTSFVQNLVKQLPKLNTQQQLESTIDSLSSTIPLEFFLESVKILDQDLSEARDRNPKTCFYRYFCLLSFIDFSANRIKEFSSMQFPLRRSQLGEAFGDASSGIWQIKNISPGKAAYLSLNVLFLEAKHCEPQTSLSESQKAAIDQFHRLASMDGMSPQILLSRCSQAVSQKATVGFLSKIRGDIAVHLMFPDITGQVLDPAGR